MNINELVNITEEELKTPSRNSGRINNAPRQMISEGANIDNLDKMVFGAPVNDNSVQFYDPKEDMKRMTQGLTEDKLSRSKLPDIIKKSIASDPLTLSPVTDTKMDAFTKKLTEAMPGIQKSMGILQQLNESDKEKQKKRIDEALIQNNNNSTIDYNIIKNIVEEAVEKKIQQYATLLTEDRSRTGGNAAVMKIGEKFMMLDDQDNVYECQMVYKGKNKKRKK